MNTKHAVCALCTANRWKSVEQALLRVETVLRDRCDVVTVEVIYDRDHKFRSVVTSVDRETGKDTTVEFVPEQKSEAGLFD